MHSTRRRQGNGKYPEHWMLEIDWTPICAEIGQRATFKDVNGSGRACYEFDLTVAPDDDPSAKDDMLFSVSATVLNKRLFVCIVQCDEAQLKRAGSDLQLVRSSFQVKDA
jgi:hypothetical protein